MGHTAYLTYIYVGNNLHVVDKLECCPQLGVRVQLISVHYVYPLQTHVFIDFLNFFCFTLLCPYFNVFLFLM